MRTVVYKYPLQMQSEQSITIPGPACYDISLAVQDGQPWLWVRHDHPDDAVGTVEVKTLTVGTGQDIHPTGLEKVGMFFLDGGRFVGHVYRVWSS